MKLLVIVLSLLSERYLVHVISQYRHHHLQVWISWVIGKLPDKNPTMTTILSITAIFLPLLGAIWFLSLLLSRYFYGFFDFLLSLLIFYYCLGKENVFYPVSAEDDTDASNAASYLAGTNVLVFAPLFWFILLGPYGALLYRLADLLRRRDGANIEDGLLAAGMEWVSARVAAMFFLLAGNFQKGFRVYTKLFFSKPSETDNFLSNCGILAAEETEQTAVSVAGAQVLFEHALVIYLVFLAFFTLAALA